MMEFEAKIPLKIRMPYFTGQAFLPAARMVKGWVMSWEVFIYNESIKVTRDKCRYSGTGLRYKTYVLRDPI